MSLDEYKAWAQVKPLGEVPESTDIAADLLKLMASPNLASRRWVWEQYDQSVGGDTVQPPGGDAAVVRVHGSRKALAMTTDCTPRYVYADPYEGGKQAIAEAYRNLCAVGARPLAVTNCLNFGNPQRPEIMAQFVEALRGMGDACRALDFPIVSGNVSLYNETKNDDGSGLAILPTPAIGGVGLLEDWEKSATIAFKAEGQHIWLIGADKRNGHLGQSLWLREALGKQDGPPPQTDLAVERRVAELVLWAISNQLVTAVHDVSDGGLLVAVAEMALAGSIGAVIDPDWSLNSPVTAAMFGEGQNRFVITVANGDDHRVVEEAEKRGVEFDWLGITGGDDISIGDYNAPQFGSVPLADLRAAHEGFFPKLMGADGALA